MARAKGSLLVQTAARRSHVPDSLAGRYEPATELAQWVRASFVDEAAPLLNPDHVHLRHASVGFLWAADANKAKGRTILGCAQLGKVHNSDVWLRGEREQQIRDWFGSIPDFLIHIDTQYWESETISDAHRCALVEHELYHCAQAVDEDGSPLFTQDGLPRWTMRPHDIEEFIGVVQRYGADACHARDFANAVRDGPRLTDFAISSVCGTCRR